jgi:hypothetical protein
MNAAVVVPIHEFFENAAQMTFIPDQHPIKTLPTQGPYQPLNMSRSIGCAIGDGHATDSHLLPEPNIICGSTRYLLSGAFRTEWPTKLTELPVVVVEQELGLFLETSIADLLFCPLERRMGGDVYVDYLSTREFHDQEDIEDTKANRVLHNEVAAPDGFGLALQKASPGLGISRSGRLFEHVSPDG